MMEGFDEDRARNQLVARNPTIEVHAQAHIAQLYRTGDTGGQFAVNTQYDETTERL